MGILAVNLKHYYQRRGLWFWYLFIVSQLGIWRSSLLEGWKSGSLIESSNIAVFFAYALVTFFPGMFVGTMVKETISKPFSFCMPGHREVARKVVFLIGGVVSVLLSLMFIFCQTRTFGHALLVVLAGGFIAMVLYLLGVMCAMGRQNRIGIPFVLMFIVCGAFFAGGDKHIARFVVSSPAVVILLGVTACVMAWWQLGRESLARENCGNLVLGMMDGWNMEKKRLMREMLITEKMGNQDTGIFAGLGEFFLGKMAGCEFYSMSRYVWGHVYAVMGRFFGVVRWRNLMPWPILVIVCGYLGRDGFSVLDIVFVMLPVFVALMVDFNAYPTVLVPGGRRERAWGAVASGVAMTAIAVAFVSVLTGVSMWLETILPAVTVKGHEVEYAAMSFAKLPLLLIFMPLSLAMGMLFPRGVIAKIVMIIIMSQVWFASSTLSRLDFFKPIAAINNPVSIIVIIAAVWLLYIWSINRHFRRGQLV